jgi:hypothetical protein
MSLAPFVTDNRMQSMSDNAFHGLEVNGSNMIATGLDDIKVFTDSNAKKTFRLLYNQRYQK